MICYMKMKNNKMADIETLFRIFYHCNCLKKLLIFN